MLLQPNLQKKSIQSKTGFNPTDLTVLRQNLLLDPPLLLGVLPLDLGGKFLVLQQLRQLLINVQLQLRARTLGGRLLLVALFPPVQNLCDEGAAVGFLLERE